MLTRFINLTSDAFSGSHSWAWDPWTYSHPQEMAAVFRVTSPARSDAYADTSGNLFFGVSASTLASSNQAPTPPPRMDSLTLSPCCPTPARSPPRRPSPPPPPPTQNNFPGMCCCQDCVEEYKWQHNL